MRDQAAIEPHDHRVVGQTILESDLGVSDPHQEQHASQAFGQIVLLEQGFRHTGEGRELVDHALDIVDLANDRIRALIEDLLVDGNQLPVLALDTLSGKLNWRQGILDLVRDAARHVAPGGGALRVEHVGDVVKRGRRRSCRSWPRVRW